MTWDKLSERRGLSKSEYYSLSYETRELANNHIEGRNVEFDVLGNPSANFVRKIQKTYSALSPEVRSFIGAQGINIKLGRYYTDVFPKMANTPLEPTANDLRTDWDQIGGVYDILERNAMVTEYEIGTWAIFRNPAAILRHELGHAMDYMLRYPALDGFKMSDVTSFKAAYEADIAALGGNENVQRIGLGYFGERPELNDGGMQGRGEVFAELWAHKNGGGVNSNIKGNFFHAAQWMNEFHHGFTESYKKGIMPLGQFVDHFCNRELAPLPTPTRAISLADGIEGVGDAAIFINLTDAVIKNDPRKAVEVVGTTAAAHAGIEFFGRLAGAEMVPVAGEVAGGVFAGVDAYDAANSGHAGRATLSSVEATLYTVSAAASVATLADFWNPTVIAPAAVALIAGGAAITITAAKGIYDNWDTVKGWFSSSQNTASELLRPRFHEKRSAIESAIKL